MKLSRKIFNIVSLTFFITIFIIYLLYYSIFLKKFIDIEITNAQLDTKRAFTQIEKEASDIDSLCINYSSWDETYNFIRNLNSNYIYENFPENNVFKRFGINFIIFFDKSNNAVFTNIIDESCTTNTLLSSNAKLQISTDLAEFTKKNNTFHFSGVYMLSKVPLTISIEPILPTNGRGEPRGFIMLAKYLDEKEANAISNNLASNVQLINYDSALLNNISYHTDSIYIKINNPKIITGYAVIKDLKGTPAILAKITLERTIYQKAIMNVRFFILMLTLIGIMFIIILFILLNKLVINRIKYITYIVDKVSKTQDLSIRVNMLGTDEISQLSNHFDIMFNSLQKTKEQILKNIHEKREAEERILTLANYDTLTNLPNRKMLIDVVDALVSNVENKFAILFIDLDNFKNINDSLGHQAGDIVLQKVVKRLRRIAPFKDYIFRMGGDEFIIIDNNASDKEKTEELAKEIISTLKPPLSYMDNIFYIGASIGISFYPEDGTNLHTLMKNSDTAMYEAKMNGGNSYKVFSYEMNEKAVKALHMSNALRVAVKKDEFVLHYQPIMNIKTNRIIGCEALIRWNYKDKIIYPGDFIKLAKDIGIMVTIDNWVLYNACHQCKTWQLEGRESIYVSVNVSFNQLKQQDFPQMVSHILDELQLLPSLLNLEITEDEAMVDVELTVGVLKQLKNLGVKISLDDFGTGYSSLSYVNKLPIDSLKIDRSLIINLTDNLKNIEIIKSIIYMAHNLDINVVTEGVETEDQFNILKDMNCDLIQGFLLSKPLDVESFEKFMNKNL